MKSRIDKMGAHHYLIINGKIKFDEAENIQDKKYSQQLPR